MQWGAYGALAGAALGLVGLVAGGARGTAGAALVIGLAAFAGPFTPSRIWCSTSRFLSASTLKLPHLVWSGGIGFALRQPPQAYW